MCAMSHYGRDSEKQAFSYMDGVVVKISEKYKPPRKVALSVGFQHRFPVETGTEEYDFKLERSVLSKMGEWKKLRQADVAARKERIGAQDAAWEERISKQLQNFALQPSSEVASSSGSSSKTYSDPTVSSTLSQNISYPSSSIAYCSSSQSVVSSSSVTYSNCSMASSSNNVVYSHSSIIAEQTQCLPSSILTPVPFSHATNEMNSKKTFSQFNFSDFEADTSSPFDNMELKTINDMEELAHVLQPPDSNKNEPTNSNVVLSNNYSSPAAPYNVNQTVTYYNTISYKSDKGAVTQSHINGYSSYSTEPRVKDQRSRNENYITLSDYASGVQQELGNSYYFIDQSWNADNVCHSTASGDVMSEIIGDQSLERLDYSAVPLMSGLSFPSTYNQHSSSNQDQGAPTRSLSRSVPDIVEELEKELIEKRIADTTSYSARASNTPPPRPNSFGSTGLEDWKPWPDLDSPEQSQSRGKAKSSMKKSPVKKSPVKQSPVSSLPNPFHKLTPEGQQLARHISEMGFTLPRVARACTALGEDGKKVVEFLLQVQSLEESWPGDLAENALLLNECDFSRAVKYLEAMTQLLDLGFPEDKVSQALVMFNNDRDKALDHIIS